MRCSRSSIDGKPLDFADIEDLDEDTSLGVGKVEDFTWKGLLDFTSCTECGRCQSQCPAWNTGKPLSPEAADHGSTRARVRQGALSAGGRSSPRNPARGDPRRRRPGRWSDPSRSPTGVPGVIDPDVLWSCTTCGACVQQCPVDIEHVDHILDMRRFEVMMSVGVPERAQRPVQRPGEQGKSMEHEPSRPAGLGQGSARFECRSSARTSRTSARSSTCSGSAAPGRTKTGPRRPRGPSRSCCTLAGVSYRRTRQRRDVYG